MKFFRSVSLPIAGLALVAMLAGCGDNGNPVAPFQNFDTTPPPAPTNLSLTNDASGHPVLTWTESAAPDVARYQVYVHSSLPGGGEDFVMAESGNTQANVFRLPSLIVSEEATYAVRAVDTSNNFSSLSAPLTIVIPVPGGSSSIDPFEIP